MIAIAIAEKSRHLVHLKALISFRQADKGRTNVNLSQRSALQKNGNTKLGKTFFDEGWQRSSSQMPPSSAQSSKCNMACCFIVRLATLPQPSPQSVWWQCNDCAHMPKKNMFVTKRLVAWAGRIWKSATKSIDLPAHKRSIRIVYFMWSLVKVLTHERTLKGSLWQPNRSAQAEPLIQ